MSINAISTSAAPAAIGPYSQAIVCGGLIFTAGQIGLQPASGQLVAGGVEEEARQALENAKAILEAAGSSMARVVKTTLFLVDMADFTGVNAIYAGYFTPPMPARSTVAVAALPRGARFEIELVAAAGD